MSEKEQKTSDKITPKPAPKPAEKLTALSPSLPLILQRAKSNPCSLSSGEVIRLQRTVGNQGVNQLLAGQKQESAFHPDTPTLGDSPVVTVQAKTTVGEPDDLYEREADAVAEQVMRMPASPLLPSEENRPNSPSLATEMTTERNEGGPMLQAKGEGAAPAGSNVEAGIERMQSIGGQPLPAKERNFFEERMGTDFSKVRIHTDPTAVQTSRDLNARAFTVGTNIAFNAGEYAPGTTAGRTLLAHELTHVVQQGGAVQCKRKEPTAAATDASNELRVTEAKGTVAQCKNKKEKDYGYDKNGKTNWKEDITSSLESLKEPPEPKKGHKREKRSGDDIKPALEALAEEDTSALKPELVAKALATTVQNLPAEFKKVPWLSLAGRYAVGLALSKAHPGLATTASLAMNVSNPGKSIAGIGEGANQATSGSESLFNGQMGTQDQLENLLQSTTNITEGVSQVLSSMGSLAATIALVLSSVLGGGALVVGAGVLAVIGALRLGVDILGHTGEFFEHWFAASRSESETSKEFEDNVDLMTTDLKGILSGALPMLMKEAAKLQAREHDRLYGLPPDNTPPVAGLLTDQTTPVAGLLTDQTTPVAGLLTDQTTPVAGLLTDQTTKLLPEPVHNRQLPQPKLPPTTSTPVYNPVVAFYLFVMGRFSIDKSSSSGALPDAAKHEDDYKQGSPTGWSRPLVKPSEEKGLLIEEIVFEIDKLREGVVGDNYELDLYIAPLDRIEQGLHSPQWDWNSLSELKEKLKKIDPKDPATRQQALETLLQAYSKWTFEHSVRVGELAKAILESIQEEIKDIENYEKILISMGSELSGSAKERLAELKELVNMTDDEVNELVALGRLHDIGKLFVPLELIDFHGKLDDNQFESMNFHTVAGEKILEGCGFDRNFIEAAGWHHSNKNEGERIDKFGKVSEKIATFIDIMELADILDALISDRPYKTGMKDLNKVFGILDKESSMKDRFLFNNFVKGNPYLIEFLNDKYGGNLTLPVKNEADVTIDNEYAYQTTGHLHSLFRKLKKERAEVSK